MNSPAYDLHAAFPAHPSPLPDSSYEPIIHDDLAYPLFASHADLGHPYPGEYPDTQPIMAGWSPDIKKQYPVHQSHVYQIPRSQNLYSYHEVKSATPYVVPSLQRDVQQQQTVIHSPHSGHPLQQHHPAPVFNLDEEWQHHTPPSGHYNPHGHLASYPNSSSSPSDPPRIKQEELSAFPAMPGYSDSQLLHQQHQRNSVSGSYEPLNLPLHPPHDPNHNIASYQAMLSPLQTHSSILSPHSHSQPQSAPAYYTSPFQQASQPQQLQGTPAPQQQHLHVRQQASRQPHPQEARSFPPFNGGTVHPAELSPATESCTSVSPLSTYADLSAGVVGAACDHRFVCQPQHIDLKNSLGWRSDRRDSLASIHSDLSGHSHGIVEIEMGMDDVDGLGVSMTGVVAGGMPMDMSEAVGGEEDATGEEDAEGEEDWEQIQSQGSQQFRVEELQYLDQGHNGAGGQMQRDEEPTTEANQGGEETQQQNNISDDEGEDEVATESEGVEVEGERDIEVDPEYDSELTESESEEDEDDPDDPEFVPRSRRRVPLRRQLTYPAAGSNESSSAPYQTFAYSSIAGEGRTLRPRSSSARYTPYPGSYPEASFYAEDQDFDQQDAESNGSGAYSERANGKRSNSTSSVTSSSTHPPRSGSSLSASSGITTTTTTARRRLRLSNTLPIPIPVPNLTKKSRGRRVPTMSSLEDVRSAASGAGKKRQTAGKAARMYLCDVEGCGKCFARGEHLKRHVRSIHTYEKPHKCLYPGCGKDFSRHDNLGQHMRVHKDYVQEGVTVAGSTRRSTSSSSRRKAPTQN